MEKTYKFLANTVFIIHLILGIFILTGWIFSSIKIPYLLVLMLWLFSWVFLNHCPLTKLELSLRKKYDNSIDINTEIIQYYINKIFKKTISSKKIFIIGLIILIILIILTLVE